MSDLTFVCVSPDLDFAEALADVFETAGHTISDDEHDACAAIVIWSNASRRSSAFLAAAKRATDAGKAIIVSREDVSAGSIEGAPVFDLTAWDANPDSAAIDSLFNAVDRKLIASRFDQAAVPVAASAEFQPRRVRANDTRFWKRGSSSFGNAARAFALVAVLAGGALGLTTLRPDHAPAAPAVRAAIVTERAVADQAIEPTAMRVAFADAVTDDASLDELVPPEPSLPTGYRSREPPSASSVPRSERARSAWRDAAYTPESQAMLVQAAYQPEASQPTLASPQPSAPKPRAKHG